MAPKFDTSQTMMKHTLEDRYAIFILKKRLKLENKVAVSRWGAEIQNIENDKFKSSEVE